MVANTVALKDQRPSDRQRLVKVIHVAKRELQLDEPTYRTMLRTAGGADSTTQMDMAALRRVVEHAKRAGFKVRHKSRDRTQDTSHQARKVRALWLFLHTLGAAKNPSEAALAIYVKRIAKVDDLHWAHGEAMLRLIETMKKWAMRVLPAAIASLREEAMHAHQACTLTVEQQHLCQQAHALTRYYIGFDSYLYAWELWMQALNRAVPSTIGELTQ